MIIQINNVVSQNIIFFVLISVLFLIFLRKRKDSSVLSIDSTSELKGYAILSIILAHIGYCLVSDNHFLQPLSSWAGVGVDVFFFLSGFGLTISALKKDLSIKQFYLKRLSKVIVPVWIFLVVFLILDKFVLGISYSISAITKSFLGFFSTADIYKDINSPLWFITPLLFYYALFPILFRKKYSEISAILLLICGYGILKFDLPIAPRVRELWTLHYIGFPFGVFFASIFTRLKNSQKLLELKNKIITKGVFTLVAKYFGLTLLIIFLWLASSYVGFLKDEFKEQLASLVVLLIVVFIFILKPIENRFFVWFGAYSFEIYLLHWVLVYRYDFVYKFLPAGVATFLYLFIFLGISYLFNKIKDVKLPVWKQLMVKK